MAAWQPPQMTRIPSPQRWKNPMLSKSPYPPSPVTPVITSSEIRRLADPEYRNKRSSNTDTPKTLIRQLARRSSNTDTPKTLIRQLARRPEVGGSPASRGRSSNTDTPKTLIRRLARRSTSSGGFTASKSRSPSSPPFVLATPPSLAVPPQINVSELPVKLQEQSEIVTRLIQYSQRMSIFKVAKANAHATRIAIRKYQTKLKPQQRARLRELNEMYTTQAKRAEDDVFDIAREIKKLSAPPDIKRQVMRIMKEIADLNSQIVDSLV